MSSIIKFYKPATTEYLKLTSASKKKYSLLPAWIMCDAQLRRDCFTLEAAGWQLYVLMIGGMRQVLFSHPEVRAVPARFLTVAEAKKAQFARDAVAA